MLHFNITVIPSGTFWLAGFVEKLDSIAAIKENRFTYLLLSLFDE